MISPVLPTINVLYENLVWIPPLREALEREGFRVRLVHVNEGIVDPSAPPPDGIWMNRISPSSHTRGHVHTVELARQLLFWLESHGRRVINGLRAFELEMSKLRQDLVLRRHGIRTPRTVLAVGREHLRAAAATFDGPFITKHDQGGKGLGIRLFRRPCGTRRASRRQELRRRARRQGDPPAVHPGTRTVHHEGGDRWRPLRVRDAELHGRGVRTLPLGCVQSDASEPGEPLDGCGRHGCCRPLQPVADRGRRPVGPEVYPALHRGRDRDRRNRIRGGCPRQPLHV